MASAKPKAMKLGASGNVDLPECFGEAFHESLVHEAARADMAARRRGTASTLTRAEVAMTTAKAWRQKGTGRARAGALSVPHRYGGGVAFGPKPRRYAVKMNRKARRRAMRAALGVHADRGSVAVFDASGYDPPSTKKAAGDLSAADFEGSILIVLTVEEIGALKSFRNISRVTVARSGEIGVADVIGAGNLAISETALADLEGRLG